MENGGGVGALHLGKTMALNWDKPQQTWQLKDQEASVNMQGLLLFGPFEQECGTHRTWN